MFFINSKAFKIPPKPASASATIGAKKSIPSFQRQSNAFVAFFTAFLMVLSEIVETNMKHAANMLSQQRAGSTVKSIIGPDLTRQLLTHLNYANNLVKFADLTFACFNSTVNTRSQESIPDLVYLMEQLLNVSLKYNLEGKSKTLVPVFEGSREDFRTKFTLAAVKTLKRPQPDSKKEGNGSDKKKKKQYSKMSRGQLIKLLQAQNKKKAESNKAEDTSNN